MTSSILQICECYLLQKKIYLYCTKCAPELECHCFLSYKSGLRHSAVHNLTLCKIGSLLRERKTNQEACFIVFEGNTATHALHCS